MTRSNTECRLSLECFEGRLVPTLGVASFPNFISIACRKPGTLTRSSYILLVIKAGDKAGDEATLSARLRLLRLVSQL